MSHPGNPKQKSLAIAYSVKRKAKKASGGSVQSGSKDMNYADGGEVSAANERRPMPDERNHDNSEVSRNSEKKAISQSQWDDQPTMRQARKGMKTTPIKHPSMVPQSGYSVRLRDQEDTLLSSAAPGQPKAQPANWMDEEEAAKQGKSMPQAYAKGGGVQDHNVTPSADEGRSMARALDELRPDRKGPSVPKEETHVPHSEMFEDVTEDSDSEMNPAHGHFSMDDSEDQPREASEDHDDSLTAAIMARRRALKADVDAGSSDMDTAAMYALGGEILEDSPDEISSHDSIYSDDSDQADLSRNADEDANEEDQLSYNALRKENYSESDGLRKMEQPHDSNTQSDSEEASSHDEHDLVGSIRRKMKSLRK